MSRYDFIQRQARHYPVRRLCQVLGVGVASYYRWQKKGATRLFVPAWERTLYQVWVGDITYLPLQNGAWAYLAAFQNVYSKRVVG